MSLLLALCVWTPVCIYSLPFSVVRSSGCQSLLRACFWALYCLPVALYMSFLTGSRAWTAICLYPSLGTLLIMWNRDKAVRLCAAEWQKAPVTWINACIYDGVLPLQSNHHPPTHNTTPPTVLQLTLPAVLFSSFRLIAWSPFICSVLKHGSKHWYLMAPMSFKHPLNIQGFGKSGEWAEWQWRWWQWWWVGKCGQPQLDCCNAMKWNMHALQFFVEAIVLRRVFNRDVHSSCWPGRSLVLNMCLVHSEKCVVWVTVLSRCSVESVELRGSVRCVKNKKSWTLYSWTNSSLDSVCFPEQVESFIWC